MVEDRLDVLAGQVVDVVGKLRLSVGVPLPGLRQDLGVDDLKLGATIVEHLGQLDSSDGRISPQLRDRVIGPQGRLYVLHFASGRGCVFSVT